MSALSLVRHRDTDTFSAEDLVAIVTGEVLAVRIRDFCPWDVCRIMAERLLRHHRLAYYPHAPSIGRVMTAFYEGRADPTIRHQYYEDVRPMAYEFRRISWPYLNPLDHFRLILDDVWPFGAERERIHACPMAFGLAQIFKTGAAALPHQDFLRMDEPGNPRTQTLVTQLTALIYVQTAAAGGELQLWPTHYRHEDFVARKKEGSYGLDYERIPPPAVTMSPAVGDLIMADSTRVHAVMPVTAGTRVAVNCFIGFRGVAEALTLWS